MDFVKDVNERTCYIVMSGHFTFSDHGKFRDLVDLVETNAGIANMILDFGKVDFIDSAALGMLLVLREEAEKRKVALEIRSPSGQVGKMLKISKFDHLFSIK